MDKKYAWILPFVAALSLFTYLSRQNLQTGPGIQQRRIYPVERQIVRKQKLIVNPYNLERYLVQKDFDSGIEDMRALLSGEYEEAWVFLPKHREWVEIGAEESSVMYSRQGVSMNLEVDTEGLESLIYKESDPVFVHIHPSSKKLKEMYLKMYAAGTGGIRQAELKNLKEIIDTLVLASLAVPSVEDMVHAFYMSSEIYKVNPSAHPVFVVCSDLGLATYEVTQEGKEYFLKHPGETCGLVERFGSTINLVSMIGGDVMYSRAPAVHDKEGLKPLLKVSFRPHKGVGLQSLRKYFEAVGSVEDSRYVDTILNPSYKINGLKD